MEDSKLAVKASIVELKYKASVHLCEHCGTEHHIDDLRHINGEDLCKPCYNNTRYNHLIKAERKMPEHKVLSANQEVCTEPEHNIIHLDRLDVRPHELESLDEFYCPTCNKFWREP
jgi:hypothetical protein